MSIDILKEFLSATATTFSANKRLADRAIEQVEDDKLRIALDGNTNSVAVIMKHVAGNLVSRWTDFLTADGEKPTRNRDDEFVDNFTGRAQILDCWERGWSCFLLTRIFMKQLLERIIGKSPLRYLRRDWQGKSKQVNTIAEWERRGKPVPPPHIVKQRTIRDYATKFGIRILVETGTYQGEMVAAMKDHFDRVYSIELSKELFEKARVRFRGVTNIELVYGDSGIELGNVVSRLRQPALFWLDGHYSAGETAKGEKETPVYEELEHILNAPDRRHCIIIDDARCFGTDPAYPSIEELAGFIRSKRIDIDIAVQDDSIRVTPRL